VPAFQASATECCTGIDVIVSTTVTVFVVPPPVSVTWPVYVPAFSPVVDGLTASVAGVVPEAGESPSHVWSLVPVKDSVPVPVLVMLNAAGATLDAPACAAKFRLVVLIASTGAVTGGGAVYPSGAIPEP